LLDKLSTLSELVLFQ